MSMSAEIELERWLRHDIDFEEEAIDVGGLWNLLTLDRSSSFLTSAVTSGTSEGTNPPPSSLGSTNLLTQPSFPKTITPVSGPMMGVTPSMGTSITPTPMSGSMGTQISTSMGPSITLATNVPPSLMSPPPTVVTPNPLLSSSIPSQPLGNVVAPNSVPSPSSVNASSSAQTKGGRKPPKRQKTTKEVSTPTSTSTPTAPPLPLPLSTPSSVVQQPPQQQQPIVPPSISTSLPPQPQSVLVGSNVSLQSSTPITTNPLASTGTQPTTYGLQGSSLYGTTRPPSFNVTPQQQQQQQQQQGPIQGQPSSTPQTRVVPSQPSNVSPFTNTPSMIPSPAVSVPPPNLPSTTTTTGPPNLGSSMIPSSSSAPSSSGGQGQPGQGGQVQGAPGPLGPASLKTFLQFVYHVTRTKQPEMHNKIFSVVKVHEKHPSEIVKTLRDMIGAKNFDLLRTEFINRIQQRAGQVQQSSTTPSSSMQSMPSLPGASIQPTSSGQTIQPNQTIGVKRPAEN